MKLDEDAVVSVFKKVVFNLCSIFIEVIDFLLLKVWRDKKTAIRDRFIAEDTENMLLCIRSEE